MLRSVFTGLALLAFAINAQAQSVTTLDRQSLAAEIGERTVSFLARDMETGQTFVLEGSDLATRHAPWSTFKIPNLLIALETGAVPDLDTVAAWDQERRPALNYWPESWRQDQTLRSAFQRSAVWYFQDLALAIDGETYRQTLSSWNYGNADVPDGSDEFWLGRELQLSVNEQVQFITRLLADDLSLTASTTQSLMDASFVHEAEGYVLHGKTGSGPVRAGVFSGRFEGWFVGFVRRQNRAPVAFALHAHAPSFRSIRTFRREFATRLLIEARLLPVAFAQ